MLFKDSNVHTSKGGTASHPELQTNPRNILLSSAKGSYRWLLLSVIAAVGGASADMTIALLIKYLSEAGLSGNENIALSTSIYMGVVIIAGFVLKFLIKYAGVRFGAHISFKLRSTLFSHLSKLKQSEAESRHTGNWMSVISNDAYAVEQFFTYHLSNLLFHPVMALGTFVFLFILQWKLILLCTLIVPLSLLASGFLGRPIAGKSQQVQEVEGMINSQIHDAVIGQALIKSYGRQFWLRERFDHILQQGLLKSLSLEWQKSLILPWQTALQTLPFAACILYGGWLAIYGDFQAAELLVFIYLLGYCVQSASALPELIGQLFVAVGAVRRLNEIMSYQTEEAIARESDHAARMNNSTHSENIISFNQVRFNYDERQSLTLDDITFEIDKGQFVAIVGPSGSGKSTILKLLSKLYEPDEGIIQLEGKSLSAYNPQDARSLISYVTQHAFLFPGTIADNIRYGHSHATDEEVIQASIAACAHDFIVKFPDGYNTVIGERGAGLSGGQKQRVAIARALIKEAQILILDEPTSALDAESEAIIQVTLQQVRNTKTVMVIAHRLSTIKEADLILVMDKGKIVERGTHFQLLQNNKLYAQLYQYTLEGVS